MPEVIGLGKVTLMFARWLPHYPKYRFYHSVKISVINPIERLTGAVVLHNIRSFCRACLHRTIHRFFQRRHYFFRCSPVIETSPAGHGRFLTDFSITHMQIKYNINKVFFE